MRIAVVSNTAWSIYNFRRNLIAALQQAGHQILAIGSEDPYLEKLREAGIPATGVPFTREGIGPLRELRTVFAIRHALAHNRIDVVLSFTPKGNIYAALACLEQDVAQIANVSGLGSAFIRIDTLSLWILRLYRFALRNAKHVFFQNHIDREIFLIRRIVKPERTSHLPGSGVDLARYTEAPLAQRAPGEAVFLFYGRLLWDKGVREYVEAARAVRLAYPRTRFMLLGTPMGGVRQGPSPATVKQWADEGVIEYHEWVDDARPYIAQADCIVLPSVYREGVPRTLLEAAAMGRPVITCDTVGCRDAVTPGLTGYLCRPHDAQDLAETLTRYIELDPAERQRMGHEARQKMVREFDEQIVIQRYLKIIGMLHRRGD
jgi:glycosyltransferase involved in cell wall biosynthesis